MEALFSTEAFSPQERFARWSEEFMRATGWPFPADPLDRSRFHAEVSGARVGETPLLAQRAAPYRLRYGKSEVSAAQDRPAGLLLICRAGKLHVEADGERLTAGPGEVLLLDMTRPISCEVVGENHTMKIALDRARLDASGGRKLTRHWPANKGLAPLIGAICQVARTAIE
jgi:hypothetical protein